MSILPQSRSPFQIGVMDANDGLPCVPEMYFTGAKCALCAAGYVSRQPTEDARGVLAHYRVRLSNPHLPMQTLMYEKGKQAFDAGAPLDMCWSASQRRGWVNAHDAMETALQSIFAPPAPTDDDFPCIGEEGEVYGPVCPHCGTLLEADADGDLVCADCDFVVVTTSDAAWYAD